MSQTLTEKLMSTPEGLALLQQEKLILDVTELICGLMREKGVSRAELAGLLGKSRAHVTQLLDGRANMTLRTVADAFAALGSSLHLSVTPIGAKVAAAQPETAQVTRANRSLGLADRAIKVRKLGKSLSEPKR